MKSVIASFLDPARLSESDFLEFLSTEELYLLLMHYQHQKNEYFKKYIEFLDKQMDLDDFEGPEVIEYENKKISSWNMHLLCEEAIQKCFEETTVRIKRRM